MLFKHVLNAVYVNIQFKECEDLNMLRKSRITTKLD